jgi:hypothetical protein
MSRFLGAVSVLKVTLIAASAAFARGEMLPVIVLSAVFSIIQLGAKPVGQMKRQDTLVTMSSDDRSRLDQFN